MSIHSVELFPDPPVTHNMELSKAILAAKARGSNIFAVLVKFNGCVPKKRYVWRGLLFFPEKKSKKSLNQNSNESCQIIQFVWNIHN